MKAFETQLSALDPGESLTGAEWARILGISVRGFRDRGIPHTGMEMRRGVLTKVWALSTLPDEYQVRVNEAREYHRASTAGELLSMREAAVRWEPDFVFTEKPESTQEKASKVKEVMRVYYNLLDAGRTKRDANKEARAQWLRMFGEECNECTIRRWEKKIDGRGGFEFAPNEAYCDNSDVPRIRNRREVKLGIPPALIEHFRAATTQTEHISGAYHKLVTAWVMGEYVPGLGHRQGDRPFPYTIKQLRPYAASTPARRLGSHGNARARREALPHISTTTANLRRAQLYMLDDTRIDVIATDDTTGRPVELKSYWMIDVGPRRIEGFVCREAGSIKATDVDAMLARVLRSSGIAAPGSGYSTLIKFELGTVACTPAKQDFLEGAYPGQLYIGRTTSDGGKNFPGDFSQSSSGHWMGKPHVESFMKTLAYFIEHIPGQRGGNYRRQPAALGLKGRNRESGMLDYDKGGRIDDAASLAYADRTMEYIQDGTVGDPSKRRLKINALLPVSQVIEALKAFAAYYNTRTDHRMEGFDRIEYRDTQTGAMKHRMESPNERAAHLEELCPTQRISEGNAAFLLRFRAKSVTVRAQGGVVMDLAPYRGLRFWRPDSIACHEAAKSTTCEKKYVALYDAEALLHWTPESNYRREIYLLSDSPANWREGDPIPSRFLEAPPLEDKGDRANPEDLAAKLEETKRVERRYRSELIRAGAPVVPRFLADAEANVQQMQGVITTLRTGQRALMADADSVLIEEVAGAATAATRREQAPKAGEQLAEFLAAHLPSPAAADEKVEPEIY